MLFGISKCVICCGQEWSTLCIHCNQSLIGYYLVPDVWKLDYIYISQLNSIGTNRRPKKSVVNRDFKTHYVMWPGIKYTICSSQSRYDWIIFIPRRGKARLYIQFTIKFNRNKSPCKKKKFLFGFSKSVITFGAEATYSTDVPSDPLHDPYWAYTTPNRRTSSAAS
jgi:hypothetical protein